MSNLIRTIGKLLPDCDVPWTLTIKHFYYFGGNFFERNEKLDTELNWQRLRTYHPFFKLPETEAEWRSQCEFGKEKDGQDGCLPEKAENLVKVLKTHNIKHLVSISAGEACLEYHIKKNYPELKLTLTEYTLDNVEVLKKVFKNCESVIKLDALKADWSQFAQKKDVCLLFFRLDASFDDQELRKIFDNLYQAGVVNIIYVPNLFLTVKFLLFEKFRAFLNRILGKNLTFAGYFRTKKRSHSFWCDLYQVEDINLCGSGSIKHGAARGVFLKRM